MELRPRVVLLGESLLMDGVAVSLGGRQMLGLVRLDASATDIRERLRSLHPDLVVFDLNTLGSSAILSLLREQPGTLLLGLDLDASKAILLYSHEQTTRTMNDLCQLVQATVGQNAQLSEGGERTTYDERATVR